MQKKLKDLVTLFSIYGWIWLVLEVVGLMMLMILVAISFLTAGELDVSDVIVFRIIGVIGLPLLVLGIIIASKFIALKKKLAESKDKYQTLRSTFHWLIAATVVGSNNLITLIFSIVLLVRTSEMLGEMKNKAK